MNNINLEEEKMTCFDCSDNRLNCGFCKDIEICIGCKLCETDSYVPCIHCVIECTHEISCVYRKEWEGEIMKKRKNKKDKTDKVDEMDKTNKTEMPCYTCNLKTCVVSGFCPEGVLDGLDEYINVPKRTVSSVTPTDYKKYNPHGKVWDTGITCIDDCHHKSEKTKMQLSLDVYLKLEHLQKTFPDVEFLVYGNAEQQPDNGGIFLIKDITIPKQKVGMGSIDDVQCEGHWNTVIHKHPGDTPGGFSRDDDEYVNMNHDFSLLIGSKDLSKIMGVGRKKTDCGKWIRVPLDITLEVPEISDKFFLSSLNNIEKKPSYPNVVCYPAYGKEGAWDKRQKEVQEWYKDRFY